MNIKYADALRLNQFMSSYKPKGLLSGGAILKIIGLKNELSKLQETYFKGFEQVMTEFNIEKNEQGQYTWKDKTISDKVEELLTAESSLVAAQFMTEEEFLTIVDGTIELDNLAFIQGYLMVSEKKEEKKSKK